MDFYIQKQDIVKALSLTLGVVEKRQTLPILSNVLIEVDESSMQLTATDLESQISTSSTVSNFTSGGKTTAPAKKLSELCRLLPDNSEIHITLDGDKLVIESGTGKYNLKTFDDWKKAYKNGKIPKNIPLKPDRVYSKKKEKITNEKTV